jgi:colanic acid/amylovoran biosynthesis glycosyltransferase
LTVARLHWKKGLEYGLAALHELKKEGFNFSYNIIGEGPELERLIYEVNDLGLDKEVNFLGKKNPKEVAEFMKINDVYLQPSIQEGFCNAVLEAQAAGLICVVSNAEGLAENVLHEKTGFVVPKREVKPLADALRLVFNADEQLLVQIRQQAIARVKTEFDIIDQIKKFKHFYESASNK